MSWSQTFKYVQASGLQTCKRSSVLTRLAFTADYKVSSVTQSKSFQVCCLCPTYEQKWLNFKTLSKASSGHLQIFLNLVLWKSLYEISLIWLNFDHAFHTMMWSHYCGIQGESVVSAPPLHCWCQPISYGPKKAQSLIVFVWDTD